MNVSAQWDAARAAHAWCWPQPATRAVVAVIGLNAGASLTYEELKAWCNDRMSSYKIPKDIKLVDALPRNAMGKVTKPAVRDLFSAENDE